MNRKILQSENPRYMTDTLKQQLAVIEEKTVKREMIKALHDNKPPTKGV